MIKRGSKQGFEFSFSWLFTIIIGAFILFLAIYIATKVVDVEREKTHAVRAKQIGILVTPAETGLEEGKLATIIVPEETKIFNDCDDDRGTFGSQDISASMKSSIGKEWHEYPGVESSFHNKYIFSNPVIHGEENFYILSKPLKLPFKIADLMIITSDKESYCFTKLDSSWEELKDEIEDFDAPNIQIKDSVADCPPSSKIVCFSSSSTGCDVSVISSNDGKGRVIEGDKDVTYLESTTINDRYAMLYAAIFSDNRTYECQLKRLMARAEQLVGLHIKKANYLTGLSSTSGLSGCSFPTSFINEFGQYEIAAGAYSNSRDLDSINSHAIFLRRDNANLRCSLF